MKKGRDGSGRLGREGEGEEGREGGGWREGGREGGRGCDALYVQLELSLAGILTDGHLTQLLGRQ